MSLLTIKTDRLILREIHRGDANDMFDYSKKSNVGPNAGWEPHTTPSDSINIIDMFHRNKEKGALGVWSIVEMESGKMIGTIELHGYKPAHRAELGYVLHPDYWGQGLMVEACKAVLKFGFEYLGLKRIDCNAFSSNHQSIRVCEKLGMTYIGIKKHGYLRYDGTFFDEVMYGMTVEDYQSQSKKPV